MAGRPTKYKEEYAEQAEKLGKLGLIDAEIAEYFGVTEKTLNNWKNAQPVFLHALREGKVIADANVAQKLYERATGYEWEEDVHIGGEAKITITKRLPPDATSMIFWLKNRQKDRWRDKPELSEGGDADKEAFLRQLASFLPD